MDVAAGLCFPSHILIVSGLGLDMLSGFRDFCLCLHAMRRYSDCFGNHHVLGYLPLNVPAFLIFQLHGGHQITVDEFSKRKLLILVM